MDIQDLIVEFRLQVDDREPPYLWDDEEVLRFVVDAQDMFVRNIGGIATITVADPGDDTETELLDLLVEEDEPYADLSPYILRIRSAKLVTGMRKIRVVNEADIATMSFSDYGIMLPEYFEDADTGTVDAMVLGLADDRVRWFKVPDTADTCRLNVLRLPYPRIDDQDDELEIHEQHHRHLLMWMKHLAYSKEDAETYDKDLAARNEAAFAAYCDKAKQERERQRFKPRVVQYGGIR